MIRFKSLFVIALLGLPLAAGAACVKVEKNATLPPPPAGATKLLLWLDEGAGALLAALPTQVIADNNLVIADADVTMVRNGTEAQKVKRKLLRLTFADDANKPIARAEMLEYVLPGVDSASAVAACTQPEVAGPGASPPKVGVRPADGDVCVNLSKYKIEANERWILFNSKGSLCAANYPLRQGDKLLFGLALRKGESPPANVSVDPTGCTMPTGAVVVVGTLPSDTIKLQAGTLTLSGLPSVTENTLIRVGLPLECASAEIRFKAKLDDLQGAENTLPLFARVTALLHVGTLNSKLRDSDFGLRPADGGGNVITDKVAHERGPEYVAMVVLQGLPHYLRNGYAYQGRDLVHDTDPEDRIGLAIAFGLKDPGKRFGLGLT